MEEGERTLSSISLVSAGSSIHQPRPPAKPKPSGPPFQARRSKVVRSPYLATSTPYLPSKKKATPTAVNWGMALSRSTNSAPVVTKEKWASAVRAAGISPDSWATPSLAYPPHFFLQMAAMNNKLGGRGVGRERSLSAARGKAQTGREGKDAIALQDEVVELKKTINAITRERDLSRAQVRKLEGEIARRQREIDDLLGAGHIPSRDATRSLVGKKSDSTVISSLRQQLHALESALRQKEGEVINLQRDAKVTRLKEVEIESEAYYREVSRLRALLELQQKEQLSAGMGAPRTTREARVKLKALNDTIVKLSSKLEEAEEEKEHLRVQLERSLRKRSKGEGGGGLHGERGVRGAIADRYADCQREEMLSAVVDLELKCQENEQTMQSLCREYEGNRAQYEKRIGALMGSHKDALSQIEKLQVTLSEAEASKEKLRGVVRKLKDDRTHYRSLSQKTQTELQDVSGQLSKEELTKQGMVTELVSLRERHQKEEVAREHAQRLAQRKSQVFTPEAGRKETAAVAIQRQWKRRQAAQRQKKFQEDTEQATVSLQSALRAHVTRRELLGAGQATHPSSSLHSPLSTPGSDEDSDSVAVETIQSAVRGYFTRQMALQDLVKRPIENSVAMDTRDQDTSPSETDSNEGGRRGRRRRRDVEGIGSHGNGLRRNGSRGDHNGKRRAESELVGYQAPKRQELDRSGVLDSAIEKRKVAKTRRAQDVFKDSHSSPWVIPNEANLSQESTDSDSVGELNPSEQSGAMDSPETAMLADELV